MSAKLASLVAAKPVVIFGRAGCPYCAKATSLFTQIAADFAYHDVPAMGAEGDAVFAAIEKEHNHDTYPAVFVKQRFVGGASDVQNLHAKGELTKMLE